MSGRNLMEMEASDMLDVLHFLFEEDFTAISEDHAYSRSAIREHLYGDMYGHTYKFKLPPRKDPTTGRPQGASNAFDYSEFEASLAAEEPFNPKQDRPFSSRTEDDSKPKRKITFVDAASIPLVDQSFEGLDGPLN